MGALTIDVFEPADPWAPTNTSRSLSPSTSTNNTDCVPAAEELRKTEVRSKTQEVREIDRSVAVCVPIAPQCIRRSEVVCQD